MNSEMKASGLEDFRERQGRVQLWFLAPVATIVILLHIVRSWLTFDIWRKANAVVLLSGMVFLPLAAFWGEKRGSGKIGRFQIAVSAYVFVLLAIPLER